jgi:hypothetical protein
MLDCSKIDELMMDWLYQELDGASSARVAEHVQGCARCSAEASALQRTRDAFRELSPVEPPVGLSAILLHEAARRAPSTAVAADPEAGFWGRLRSWFRPIALHPAAAAVATLVLVAGVAGTLYVRHGDEMTDTPDLPARTVTSDRESSAVAGTTPPSVDMPVVPEPNAAATPADDEGSGDRDGYVAGVISEESQAKLEKQSTLRLQREETGKRLAASEKPRSVAKSSKKRSYNKEEDPRGPIANAVSGADPLIDGEMDLRGGGGSATRGRAADKLQQAAKPPEAPPPSTSSTTAAQPGGLDFADSKGDSGAYRVAKPKPMTAAELKASEGRLGVAVKKNDCRTAAQIANDILDRNGRDYYYKKVASQTRPCNLYVKQETARRASKNVGSGGKNVGAPQKAKAAPQKDQAAEAAE